MSQKPQSECSKNLCRLYNFILLSCYHTVQLLQAVPYISHLQLFRIVQHKQTPNITVPLQHQGTYIKCHQSASDFLTVTELVQRLRQRQRLTKSMTPHFQSSFTMWNLSVMAQRWQKHNVDITSHWELTETYNFYVPTLIGWDLSVKPLNGHYTAERSLSDWRQEEGKGRRGWNKRPFVVADAW